MPTVISDEHRFAFLHIPKTAGTTVGRQLSVMLPSDPQFHKGSSHDPRVGAFWWSHLTLHEMAILAPDALDRVKRYRSVAVLRDPLDRFRSALSNYILNSHQKPPSRLSAAVVRETASQAIDACERDELTALNLTLLKPQSRYVEQDGERVVTRLFDIASLPALAQYVECTTGASLDVASRQRVAENFKRGPLATLRYLRPVVRMVLPSETTKKIAAGVKRMLRQDRDTVIEDILASLRVQRLLDDFYGRDLDLYREVREANTDPAHAPRSVPLEG